MGKGKNKTTKIISISKETTATSKREKGRMERRKKEVMEGGMNEAVKKGESGQVTA